MKSIRERLARYLADYLSPGIVFVIDLALSFLASVIALLLTLYAMKYTGDGMYSTRTFGIIWLLSALIGSVIPRFRNQIFVFDMGESVKIDDLAKRMIELAGLQLGKDIDIEYTGLRPGEKLYEEVLSNAENTIPTEHERIRIAKVREYKSKNSRFEIFDKQ